MDNQNPLNSVIEQLKKFPGIGEKSAQRLAFFLLSQPQNEVEKMATEMIKSRREIRYCETCFNISKSPTCFVCASPKRDRTKLCVVAEPRDIFALEKTQAFTGVYHVLGGLISPIDGVHPEALRIQELNQRLQTERFEEIILAINPTIEGDATILFLTATLAQFNMPITKLAYGLPAGSDIDYADELTLQKALSGRSHV